MDPAAAQDLASRYLTALDTASPWEPLVDDSPDQSLEAAYQVQAALNRSWARRDRGVIAGYKVALTSRAMQEFVGVDHPLAGVVWADVTHESPATVDHGSFVHLGIECEVAVRLGGDLGPGSGPHDRASIAAATSALHPAFELVDDRGADYSRLHVFDLTAENAWNAGVVIGPAVTDFDGLDLVESATRLRINGDEMGTGRTGDALGHPFDAAAWLINHLNDAGETVHAGQFVMTGSSIVTQFPAAGDELVFTIDEMGEVRLQL